MKFEKISHDQWVVDAPSIDEGIESYNDIMIPKRSTAYSAGYDFCAPYDFMIKPNEKYKVPTGIKVDLEPDKVLMIAPRSSIGIKHGIRMTNTQGYVDADYYNNEGNEGHIFIELENTSHLTFVCKKGDKFAQGIIIQYFKTEDDDATTVRTGGIGSTGA